jgi:RNA polymerase-interacting CarD/CdnL/TRCF family regulator
MNTDMVVRPDPYVLIEKAIEKGVDVSAMQALFDMQRQFEADQAKRAYAAAMNALQGELAPILRDKVNPQTRSKYAALETLEAVLRPLKAKHGFSSVFDTQPTDKEGYVAGVVHLHHVGGHSTDHNLALPIDNKGIKGVDNKTEVHGIGSTVSYLRRYIEAGIFNAVFSGEDDDGVAGGASQIEELNMTIARLQKQSQVYRENWLAFYLINKGFEPDGDMTAAAEAYAELTKGELMDGTNIAPKYGGLFSTEKRAMFKNREFQLEVTRHRNDAGWHDDPANQL